MSDTPRTDANVKKHKLCQLSGNDLVYANFPRQLERELTAMTAQRDELAKVLQDIYNYAKGKKPHDYHNLLSSSDQITAKFDAWQEIECKIEELLQTTPTQTKPK
jgi:hypothetical protein